MLCINAFQKINNLKYSYRNRCTHHNFVASVISLFVFSSKPMKPGIPTKITRVSQLFYKLGKRTSPGFRVGGNMMRYQWQARQNYHLEHDKCLRKPQLRHFTRLRLPKNQKFPDFGYTGTKIWSLRSPV